MYSIQALWSAAQLRLPITFIILKNRRYAALQEFAPAFGFAPGDKLEGTELPDIDFVALARGMGVEGGAGRRAGGAARALGAALRSPGRRWSRSRSPDTFNTKEQRDAHRRSIGRRAALSAAPRRRRSGALPARPRRPGRPSRSRSSSTFRPAAPPTRSPRLVGQPLQDALGQPVVVENKAGAGGNVGGDAVAKAAPDGYTLLMSSGGMVSVNPHIYAKMTFDPAKDLVPVAAAARVLVFLVVKPEFPAKNVAEFLAYVKANPGKLSFGSPGNGSSPHLAAEMMKQPDRQLAVHVPYRGAAPALQDLLGGQVDFLFDPGVALPHMQGGKLKLLAVGSPSAQPLFPDVPTLDEAGLKGFDADTVFGFYAPAGTPKPVIDAAEHRDQPDPGHASRSRTASSPSAACRRR